MSGQFVEPFEAEHLRNLCVGVQAVERIARLCERFQQRAVTESLSQLQKSGFAGEGVDVREHFVHPAVLRIEHPLELLVREVACVSDRPIR